MEKFALSGDFISRAITNKATQTGARIAPGLLNNLTSAGNRPALMSLAKNVRAPGALTPNIAQKSMSNMMNKFDYFGSEMNPAGAHQLPRLNKTLAETGRYGMSPNLEQNISSTFGPRPGEITQPTAAGLRPKKRLAGGM